MSALRTVFRYWISIVALAVIAQIAFAGYGAFYTVEKVTDATINEDMFEDGWGVAHRVRLFGVSDGAHRGRPGALARPGRRTVLMTVGALVLVIVQIVLAWIGGKSPRSELCIRSMRSSSSGSSGRSSASEWRARRWG